MYLDHFGLSESPFRITPHTDFFFSGANRGATLDALLYAVTHDEGIVKVSGEVGSGKTMLCRMLIERLVGKVAIVYLSNPSLSRDDILYAIADELQLKLPENARVSLVLRELQGHLIKLYAQGQRVVVLIDEAHAMPAESLEEIRLLSNLESNRHKLLQLVLFGQPELNGILARADMRQLKERITHNFQLDPLVRDDVAEYLEFRMRAAGYKGPNVFSPQATRLISDASIGLTRRINILADKSLLAAFSQNTHQITTREVRAAIRDCDFSDATQATRGNRLKWKTAGMAVAAFAGLAALAFAYVRNTAPLPAPPASLPALPSPQAALAQSPAPAAPHETPATASGSVTNTATAATNSSAEPGATTAAAPAMPPSSTPLTDQALAAGKEWLSKAPDEHWFLQLFSLEAERGPAAVEEFLSHYQENGGDISKIRVYLSDLSGKLRYGVTFGEFNSLTEAKGTAKALPIPIQNRHPFPRQVKQLK
ncbi:MAG TPA: AAA family ATPase [Rhodocyclaceae bacterium]